MVCAGIPNKQNHSGTRTAQAPTISRAEIKAAQARIQPYLRCTPILELESEAMGIGFPIVLKLESLQHTGSFKVRGALNSLLSKDIPEIGVVAASGGNHGAALAYAGQKLGLKTTIFMTVFAEDVKVERVRALGADVRVIDGSVTDAFDAAQRFANRTGAVSVHPFDEVETVTGQATLAAEIEAQLPEFDTLLVSVGGGGLIGGLAAWLGDRVKIVSVESEGTRTLANALIDGEKAEIEVSGIAASSLGSPRIGRISYSLVRDLVQDAIVVTDDDIVQAQRELWGSTRLIAEPGGVTALAALTSKNYQPKHDERIVVLICGANADPNWFVRDLSKDQEQADS